MLTDVGRSMFTNHLTEAMMALMMTQAELEQRIEEYFNTRHTSIWSRSWDVSEDSKSRPEATAFVIKLIKDLGLVSFVPGSLGDPVDLGQRDQV